MSSSDPRPWAQLAYQAGARINRWEFRWDRLEPRQGTWNFTAGDAAVNSSLASKLDVLGILIATPGWAAATGQKPGNGIPRGLYLPFNDPRNLWAQYVQHTVTHYAGEVNDWEIWNEPDLPFFWSGTSEDYYRLLRVAFLSIRHIDPAAKVLIAGMVAPDLGFLQRVLADTAKRSGTVGGESVFDAVAWHAYGSARSLFDNLHRIRSILAGYGMTSAPIWVTEDGFPTSNPNGDARQAAYVEQTVAYALAAGAARVLVYRASDDALPKTWGVLSAAGRVRPGYIAFQVAASVFAHSNAVVYAPSGTTERFVIYRNGQRIVMMWNQELRDQTISLPPAGTSASLLDWLGQSLPIAASGSSTSVILPGAQYNNGIDSSSSVVGGPPRFLLQDNVQPASLPVTAYVVRADGPRRRLLLFNPGDTALSVNVIAAERADEHAVLQIQSRSVQSIDLDLVAGPDYVGPFRVMSAGPVPTQEISGASTHMASTASRTWFVPSSPATLSFANPSGRKVSVSIEAYGPRGRPRSWGAFDIPPLGAANWAVPDYRAGNNLAVTVQATDRILLSRADGYSAAATPTAAMTWYAVHPAGQALTVFNPDPALSAQVTWTYVVPGSVESAHATLGPHQSMSIPSRSSTAIIVSSSRSVATGYVSPTTALPAPSPDLTAAAAFSVGRTATLQLFNPGQHQAHVILTVYTGTTPHVRTLTLAPLGTENPVVRNENMSSRGVLLQSDEPVVTQLAAGTA